MPQKTMSPPSPAPLLLTVAAVAAALSVSRRSVERMISRGILPSRRIGRRRLIPRTAVEALAKRDTPVIAGHPEAVA